MNLCFIADLRSAIAQNWIGYFASHDHTVHVISSYPCHPDLISNTQVYQVPIAFSGFSCIFQNGSIENKQDRPWYASILSNLRSGPLSQVVSEVRFWVTPLEVYRHISRIQSYIHDISPDLVHALRIPFEGIVAAKATPAQIPLITSVWGNDFTLFARRFPLIGWQTRQTLARTDALHCDCHRDAKLAGSWGFAPGKPIRVLPSSGGIQRDVFYPDKPDVTLRERLSISLDSPVIINPRGIRLYVSNESFFHALSIVVNTHPNVAVLCSGMEANPAAEQWVRKYDLERNVRLLPLVSREVMADLFRLADITVSPSLHDGTPNTLLESMACGCFPVAGDIESIREWITNDKNGLLCDPTNPEYLAKAMQQALDDDDLRQRARKHNVGLIAEHAEYRHVMVKAEQFYRQVIG